MALEIVLIDKITGLPSAVDADSGGLVVSQRSLGYDKQFTLHGVSGVIAAAAAANSVFFAMRNSATASSTTQMIHIPKLRIAYTTIVAYTVPVTAGRRLELIKITSATGPYSGGTSFTTATKKVTAGITSTLDTTPGGDIRIAAAGALTVPTTTTFETNAISSMTLSHVGGAGGFYERDMILMMAYSQQPIELGAGEMLVLRNPIAMDAGGTWQFEIDADCFMG